jgi:hypothetical protein
VVMQRLTRRSFVTSVGAASVLPASAVLGAAQGTEPAKENAANAAGTAVAGHLADADIAAAAAYFANEGSATRP